MSMIKHDHLALSVFVEATIVYGFCQSHLFSERYTLTCTILSTLVISFMHLLVPYVLFSKFLPVQAISISDNLLCSSYSRILL